MPAPTAEQVARFIAGYGPDDESTIRFAWNGKHAEEFADANAEFRKAVLDAVVADLDAAPLDLVRDLFRAETRYSREAWCVDNRISRLGEQLLRRDPERYVEDYLEGKSQSYDASLATVFQADIPLLERLLAVVRARLQTELDPDRRELLVYGEERFADWADWIRRGTV